MATFTAYSNQYADVYNTNPPTLQAPYEWKGRVRSTYFSTTGTAAAGTTGSTITLAKLPAGKVKLLIPNSVIQSTFSGTINIGYGAHTNADGTAVTASANGIVDSQVLATATVTNLGIKDDASARYFPAAVILTGGTIDFDSKEGVDIILQNEVGTIATGDITSGYLQYVID